MVLQERLSEEGYKLTLASASPRRRDLMADCGFNFELLRYSVDEEYPLSLEPSQVPLYLSALKSEGAPRPLFDGEILITADTVVICNDLILGKPESLDDARAMLTLLSARTHTVVTGVTLRSSDKMKSFTAESKVTFRKLKAEEIDYYVDNFRPLDKAGSYGIQEWIGFIGIERIEGSFHNVMGLPLQKLYIELEQFMSK
ncbi:MAG: Maf family nucleotide pyrophosphatase [Rikenellaceae bacterium]